MSIFKNIASRYDDSSLLYRANTQTDRVENKMTTLCHRSRKLRL